MDKKEFAVFAAALKTYYPKDYLIPNENAIELWYRQLQDIPYNVAQVSLNRWVATNKWPPTIAELREAAVNVVNGKPSTWAEGWEQVRAAIRNYGTNDIKGALASMDPITREVVTRLGFRELCISENPSHDRANFRMIYEKEIEREQEKRVLPTALVKEISHIQQEYLQNTYLELE